MLFDPEALPDPAALDWVMSTGIGPRVPLG